MKEILVKWLFTDEDATKFDPLEHFYNEKGVKNPKTAYDPKITIYDITAFLKDVLERLEK